MVILSSVDEVIAHLGGVRAVAELTGLVKTNVHNWRAGGRMPPEHYKVMMDALVRRGASAPSRLWGQRDYVAA